MTLGRSPPGHGCRSDILKLSNALSHSPKGVNGLDSFNSHKGTLASISAHAQSFKLHRCRHLLDDSSGAY